ncbi:MAG TPA: copper resistance protein CopC [Candidatus Dormibacteraeota bacterium]|nr:copper resistance protein CopC [Candidatus Dormibacteraeota bacterium]
MLLGADPAPDSVRESPPSVVTLIFSEPVTPAGAGMKVFSPSGRQVAAPAISRGSVLEASVNGAELGTYVVSWQVFAADTHPSRGAFRFVVGHTSANPFSALLDAPEVGTASAAGVGLQALARWVHFIGFALVVGVVGYGILVRRTFAASMVGVGVSLLIGAEPLALLGQLASLSFDGDTALAVLGSTFGRLLGLRLGAALLMWTLLATGRAWPLLATGAVIAVLDGASAHAIPGLPGVAQLFVAIHVIAMGLWVGGLAAFVRAPDRRFGRYAAITFGVAVSTGLLLAFAHTRFGSSLLTSDYGRTLLLKVLIVGVVAVAAILRRHRLELALVIGLIASAAIVAALPPPF